MLDAIDAERLERPEATIAIRLLLLTGARRSEIVWLMWQHVDLERGFINLPDSKVGKRPVFLNAAAIELLERLPRRPDNPFVFAGDAPGRPIQNIQQIWDRIRRQTGLEKVRLHGLRHSFASMAAANGASLVLIGKMLGRATPLTTQRYAHLVNDPVREANEAIGKRIAGLMKPREE